MNDVKYLTFYENWRQLRNCCTLEEWYELETMIFNLRFDGVDTDPNLISNIKLQGFWVAVRPSILKSNRNTRHNNKKKEITETDITCGKLSPTINGNPLNDTDIPSRLQCLTDGKKTVVLDISYYFDKDKKFKDEVLDTLCEMSEAHNYDMKIIETIYGKYGYPYDRENLLQYLEKHHC